MVLYVSGKNDILKLKKLKQQQRQKQKEDKKLIKNNNRWAGRRERKASKAD